MSFFCAGCYRNGMSCVVDVVSGCCGCCLEKNPKCSLVVTRSDYKKFYKIFYFFLLMFSLRNRFDKQKLSLQKELEKAGKKDAELWVEELVLMVRTSCLHEKRYALFPCEFCFRKQLGVLSKKEKKMFVRKLVSIEDLERSE